MLLERYRSKLFVGWIDPRFDCDDLRLLLEDPLDVGRYEGAERVAARPGRIVHRVSISTPTGTSTVYTHLLVNEQFRETLRPPQAYTVLRTGRKMLACGLPTARVLAAVRPRWVPLNRTSFAVTLAIPDAVPLSTLDADEFVGRIGGFKKLNLIRQIATQTAWMHAHGFYHKDLIAQNILVGRRRSTPVIWFVGLGRAGIVRWRPPYLRQWRWASDLLALMRSEIPAINERDRIVFLETYLRALGPERGADTVKKILLRRMEE
jgi:hypothetical protein